MASRTLPIYIAAVFAAFISLAGLGCEGLFYDLDRLDRPEQEDNGDNEEENDEDNELVNQLPCENDEIVDPEDGEEAVCR